ncbi:hypothetical protein, partial [Methanosarcina mazei]|uniref:hypothetical protein n=1 Tax=Methanosarcina mazei TaxID=2209 RepID=UPI00138E4E0A
RFKEKNEEARVHFIPYLKEGVFVTLCAPVVIKIYPEVKRWAATYWKILSKVWEKEPLGRKILNLNGTICCE